MASHFASVQLWPLLRRDYDDVLAYCRGCVQAIELFTSQSMAYKYNYRKSLIRSRPCIILDPKFPRLLLEKL